MNRLKREYALWGFLLLAVFVIGVFGLVNYLRPRKPQNELVAPLRNFPLWVEDIATPEMKPVRFKVLFGLYRATWYHTETSTVIRVEFQGDFDPSSEAYARCAYGVMIQEEDYNRGVWYGHNVCLASRTETGSLEHAEVGTVVTRDDRVLMKGSVRVLGEEKALEFTVPDPHFTPLNVYFVYTPDEQTQKRTGVHYRGMLEGEEPPPRRVSRFGGFSFRWCWRKGSTAEQAK